MSTKKHKIQASEVEVGSRTLEAVLLDLAEQSRENAERSARAEERATIALQTIAAVSQDLRALTQEFRGFAEEVRTWGRRTDARLDALENGSQV